MAQAVDPIFAAAIRTIEANRAARAVHTNKMQEQESRLEAVEHKVERVNGELNQSNLRIQPGVSGSGVRGDQLPNA